MVGGYNLWVEEPRSPRLQMLLLPIVDGARKKGKKDAATAIRMQVQVQQPHPNQHLPFLSEDSSRVTSRMVVGMQLCNLNRIHCLCRCMYLDIIRSTGNVRPRIEVLLGAGSHDVFCLFFPSYDSRGG